MIVPTVSQALLLLVLGGVFVHFVIAGGRTFYSEDLQNEPGALVGQLLFYVTGMMLIWYLGLHQAIPWINGIAAALLLVLAVAVYEWARHAIWLRRFGLGWGDQVPDAVCVEGPYRWVRHPIYLSYMLAFLAAFIALPHWLSAASLLLNVAVFAHGARHDERRIAASPIAEDYAAYRKRTGMFLPKIRDSRRT